MSNAWKNDWQGNTPDETPGQQAAWFVQVLLILIAIGVLTVGGILLRAYLYYEVGKTLAGDKE